MISIFFSLSTTIVEAAYTQVSGGWISNILLWKNQDHTTRWLRKYNYITIAGVISGILIRHSLPVLSMIRWCMYVFNNIYNNIYGKAALSGRGSSKRAASLIFYKKKLFNYTVLRNSFNELIVVHFCPFTFSHVITSNIKFGILLNK
jgi:hypothetical protein